MTAAYTLSIYEILFPVIKSEAKTRELVKNIELVIDDKFEEKKNILSTKEDILKLELKIAESKTDMIKWIIALLIPVYAFLIGILITILNKVI